jgi:hypothetical protein
VTLCFEADRRLPLRRPRKISNREARKRSKVRALPDRSNALEKKYANLNSRDDRCCRNAIAFQATAQQQQPQAAPSELTKEQIDKGQKTSMPNEEADKGVKTRNSGESGYVGDQDKTGALAHPPGRPDSQQTTGTGPKQN